jgi:ribosomal protein S18 acetylase RimI-like enzyme
VPGELPALVEVDVRRVVPSDWPAVRSLRLEALQDTPTAFCERAADAVRAPDADWQARAARGAVGGDSFQVLARERDLPIATAVGFLDGTGDGTGRDAVLAAVYVTPARRGVHLLDRLVEQVSAWAVEQGAPRLRLLVHERNERARRAYERLGFVPTGHTEPYPLDPSAREVELARPLPPA